jgi:hypothetical protein
MFIFSNKINSLKYFFIFYHKIFYMICLTFIFINAISGNSFIILNENDIFADFFKVMDSLKIINCWDGYNPYLNNDLGLNFLPPFSIFLYSFFATLIKLTSIRYKYFYFIFLISIFLSLFTLLKNRLSGKDFLLLLFTYPILINIQRGNFAILVFLFLLAAFIHKENKYKSMFFLSLSICIKITPFIFILPLLIGDTFNNILKKILLIIIFIIFINYISIVYINYLSLNDIYNYKLFFTSQFKYSKLMIENNGGLNFGNSFYMPFKFILSKYFSNSVSLNKLLNFSPYSISFFLSFPFLLIFIYQSIIKKSINNLVLLEFISICFLLFTPVSADYYLIILFLPLLLNDIKYFSSFKKLLYIIILLPKVLTFNNITVSSFINPFLLFLLLFICILENKVIMNETFAC